MDIITSLIDPLILALSASPEILSWCNINYNTPHTLYKGIDLREPPGEEFYPICHIFPASKTVGYDLTEKTHSIGVVVGVNNSTITTTTTENSVVIKEYQGIDHVESFRKLIETVIVANVPTNSLISNEDISYEIIESFPFFLIFSFFEITEEYCQGDNVFT